MENVPTDRKTEDSQIDEDALMRAERLLKNSQNAIKNLSAEISDKEEQVVANTNEIKRQAKVIGVLRQELDIARKDLDNIKNSTSWKITGPIRTLRNAAKRLTGG